MSSSPVIGIDFGLAYSAVGIVKNKNVEVIANDQGNRTNPSVVAFNDQEQLAGEAAKSQQSTNLANTVFDLKYMLGKKFSDKEVQTRSKGWPFKITKGPKDSIEVEVTFKEKRETFTVVQLIGFVLVDLRMLAEKYSGYKIEHCVMSAPSAYTSEQRSMLSEAAGQAGMKVLRFLQDGCAAAIAYDLDTTNQQQKKQMVCVFDCGSGGAQATIIKVHNGCMTVVGSATDTSILGSQLDDAITAHFSAAFERINKTPIKGDGEERANARLADLCQSAKHTLSSVTSASVELDSLFAGFDLYESMSRVRFESLTGDWFDRAVASLAKVLKQSKMTAADLDKVLLVGGCCRIPKLKAALAKVVGDDVMLCDTVSPNEAVVAGCVTQAGLMEQFASAKEKELSHTPHLEALTQTIGLVGQGGVMMPLLPAGTPLPAKATVQAGKDSAAQTSVCVEMVQGERVKAGENAKLCTFVVEGMAKKTTAVELVFAVDAKGVLTCSARELGAKKGSAATKELEVKGGGKVRKSSTNVSGAEIEQQDKSYAKRFGALMALRATVTGSVKDPTKEVAGAAAKVLEWCDACLANKAIPAAALTALKQSEFDMASNADAAGADDDDDESDDEDDDESDDAAAAESSDEDMD